MWQALLRLASGMNDGSDEEVVFRFLRTLSQPSGA